MSLIVTGLYQRFIGRSEGWPFAITKRPLRNPKQTGAAVNGQGLFFLDPFLKGCDFCPLDEDGINVFPFLLHHLDCGCGSYRATRDPSREAS